MEQALLGGEQGPRAVHLDASPFQDHAGRHHREPVLRGDAGGDRVVQIERRGLAAPRVEAPVEHQLLTATLPLPRAEDRAVVATPGVVGRVAVKKIRSKATPAARSVSRAESSSAASPTLMCTSSCGTSAPTISAQMPRTGRDWP